MENNNSDNILVISSVNDMGGEKRIERGFTGKLVSNAMHSVSVCVLKENMQCFFDQMKEVLASETDPIGAFQISQIDIFAQISGQGQVALMGSGAKTEAQGGIKFTLCRIPK